MSPETYYQTLSLHNDPALRIGTEGYFSVAVSFATPKPQFADFEDMPREILTPLLCTELEQYMPSFVISFSSFYMLWCLAI